MSRRLSVFASSCRRIMGTHALHVILAHQISSEGEEGDQEEERNPTIDAHQPRLL